MSENSAEQTTSPAQQQQEIKKSTLTTSVFIALIIGLGSGIFLNILISQNIVSTEIAIFLRKFIIGDTFGGTQSDVGFLSVVGELFINSIKMMIVPLVFVSLVCGISSVGDIKKLGRIGTKTILYYLVTTAMAVALALLVANLLNPGQGIHLNVEAANFASQSAPDLAQVIINLIPTNPFESMTKGSMLQIIFFSLLTGLAIATLGEKVEGIIRFFNRLNDIIMQMISIIMLAAPYGIFCLVTKVFAGQGIEMIKPLAMYMLTIVVALLLHLGIVYSGMLSLIGRLSIVTFFKKFYSAMMIAFSTASSNATVPETFKCVTEKLGVSRSVASFSIPLGATINMDGTAIMQGVAVIFISQVYGINLTMTDFLMVILTATLASIGTAGVPGVGLITLSMVLIQVGLPANGIALIIGIDRILDMSRTVVNICGDAVISLIVAKSENELDQAVYDNPNAGTEVTK